MSTLRTLAALALCLGFASAHAGGAPCGQDLLTSISAAGNTDTHAVLNRTLGKIEIQGKKSGLTGLLLSELEYKERDHREPGEEIINAVGNHFDPFSPTSLRVEEKAVLTEASLSGFLQHAQSEEFARSQNLAAALQWERREAPEAGHGFMTVSEYGGRLIYALPSSGSAFSVKARFRKYFEFPIEGIKDPEAYKQVMPGVSVLELKITAQLGPATKDFLSVEDTVFKPRIMVSDDIADRLKKLDGADEKIGDKLRELKDEVVKLNEGREKPLNDPAKVESLFEAIALLLARDPNFLKPEFATKYERTAYRFVSNGREYQFTADRNIAIFKPVKGLGMSEMPKYLKEKPLFASADGEVFTELKSPVEDKADNLPPYVALRDAMERNHLTGYKIGKGKYSIARFVEQEERNDRVDRTLFDQGTKYWLIKGTANLDSLLKKNDALTRGDIEVAFPFKYKDGRIFRVQFSYRQLNRLNGQREAVIEDIRVIDDMGFRIKVKQGLDELVKRAAHREESEILGIDIAGTIMPFKSRITHDEFEDYRSFVLGFFAYPSGLTGKPRSIERFDEIENSRQLKWQLTKLWAENKVHFVIDRTSRALVTGLVSMGAVAGFAYFTMSPAPPARPASPKPTAPVASFKADSPQILEIHGADGKPVKYLVNKLPDGKLELKPLP